MHNGNIAAAMAGQPRHISLPAQPQGEAIGYTRTGNDLLISSEDPTNSSPPVYLIPADT